MGTTIQKPRILKLFQLFPVYPKYLFCPALSILPNKTTSSHFYQGQRLTIKSFSVRCPYVALLDLFHTNKKRLINKMHILANLK